MLIQRHPRFKQRRDLRLPDLQQVVVFRRDSRADLYLKQHFGKGRRAFAIANSQRLTPEQAARLAADLVRAAWDARKRSPCPSGNERALHKEKTDEGTREDESHGDRAVPFE